MRTARASLLVLMVMAWVRLALLYSELPENVPSHFDASGQADGWSGRGEFVALFAGLVLFMGGTFFGINWLFRRLPPSMINLPNKDYWLAEERREATLDDLQSRMLWIGFVSVLFMVGIQELSVWAALAKSEGLPMVAALALTLAILAILTVQIVMILIRYSGTYPEL